MKQQDLGLNGRTRRSRKEVLLDGMTSVVPFAELVAHIGPMQPWPEPDAHRLIWMRCAVNRK